MRLFINAVFDLKTKYGDILADVSELMGKNNWENERTLFQLDDSVNDAKTESRTPHAMLCKSFPQMLPYWHDYEGYVREYGELVNIKPVKPEMFCNFPGIVNGEIRYMTDDEQITNALMIQIAKKIPKPYSFYQAIIAFFNLFDEVNLQSFFDKENELAVKVMYEGFAYYFKRFEEEAIPMLEKNFGETHQAFYQESYEFDWYWYQSIMSAWMDEKRRNKLPIY